MVEEILSNIWPRPCSNMEVQLEQPPEYLLWTRSWESQLMGVELVECGFDIRLPKKFQWFCFHALKVMRVMSFLCLVFSWPGPYNSTIPAGVQLFPKSSTIRHVSSSNSWKKSLLSVKVPTSSRTSVSTSVSSRVSITLSSSSWQLAALITKPERWLGVVELRSRHNG